MPACTCKKGRDQEVDGFYPVLLPSAGWRRGYVGILLIRSWNAGHAGPPRVSTGIYRVHLLTIISEHVAARPQPAAANTWLLVACAVDLGCCVLLLVLPLLLPILLRVPCPEASAVDLGCSVLLLAPLIWSRQSQRGTDACQCTMPRPGIEPGTFRSSV